MGDAVNDRNSDAQDDAAGNNPLAQPRPICGDPEHRHFGSCEFYATGRMDAAAARPHCQPGCNRVDGHDGRDPGACMRDGADIRPPRPAGWSINRERLAQQDAARDDAARAPRPLLGEVFTAVREALAAELVPLTVIDRAMNRLLYGNPCGPTCFQVTDPDTEQPVTVHVHVKVPPVPQEFLRAVQRAVLDYQRRNPGPGGLLR